MQPNTEIITLDNNGDVVGTVSNGDGPGPIIVVKPDGTQAPRSSFGVLQDAPNSILELLYSDGNLKAYQSNDADGSGIFIQFADDGAQFSFGPNNAFSHGSVTEVSKFYAGGGSLDEKFADGHVSAFVLNGPNHDLVFSGTYDSTSGNSSLSFQNLTYTTPLTEIASGNVDALITNDGGSLISHDGGSIVGNDGTNGSPVDLISHDGGSLISHDGGSLNQDDVFKLVGNDGSSLISHDGGSLISQDGGGIISPTNVISNDGSSLTGDLPAELTANFDALAGRGLSNYSSESLATTGDATLGSVASSAAYNENDAAVVLSPGATVGNLGSVTHAAVQSLAETSSNSPSATVASATVQINGGTFANDGDVLAADVAGTAITAHYDSATETLTLSGADTPADYQQVLSSVTFQSTSLNATNSGANPTRTVDWYVTDGSGSPSLVQQTIVNVTADNFAQRPVGDPISFGRYVADSAPGLGPNLTTVLTNGDLVEADWAADNDGEATSLKINIYDPSGTVVTTSPAPLGASDVTVQALTGGGFVVVYQATDYYGLNSIAGTYAEIFSADGTLLQNLNISPAGAYGGLLSVAATPDGGFFVTQTPTPPNEFSDYFGNNDPVGASAEASFFSSTGVAEWSGWANDVPRTTVDGFGYSGKVGGDTESTVWNDGPSAAALADGNVAVGYSTATPLLNDAGFEFSQAYPDIDVDVMSPEGGNTFIDVYQVPDAAEWVAQGAQDSTLYDGAVLVALSSSSFGVLWLENSFDTIADAEVYSLHFKAYDDSGDAQTGDVVITTMQSNGPYQVAALPGGNFVLAYVDSGPMDSELDKHVVLDVVGSGGNILSSTTLNAEGDPASLYNLTAAPDGSYYITVQDIYGGIFTYHYAVGSDLTVTTQTAGGVDLRWSTFYDELANSPIGTGGTDTRYSYVDLGSFNGHTAAVTFVVTGTDFTYSGSFPHIHLTGGLITGIEEQDDSGNVLATFSGLTLPAATLNSALSTYMAGGTGSPDPSALNVIFLSNNQFNPTGSSGSDHFQGGAFTNTFTASTGNDFYTGGTGPNTVNYSGLSTPGLVVLVQGGSGTVNKGVGGVSVHEGVNQAVQGSGAAVPGSNGTDTLTNVGNLVGSTASDVFYVDASENVNGGGGFDYLIELTANVALSYGTNLSDITEFVSNVGNNSVNFANDTGFAYLFGSTGNDTLTLGSGGGFMFGEGGTNVLSGGANATNLFVGGDGGTDTMNGGSGTASNFYFVDGNDQVNGAGAFNTVIELVAGVTAQLGSALNADVQEFVSNSGANVVTVASTDSDFVYLYGGSGNDTLTTGSGGGYLFGEGGTNVLSGGGSLNVFVADGATGIDTMNGGSGSNIYYIDNNSTVHGAGTFNTVIELQQNATLTLGSAQLGTDVQQVILNGGTNTADFHTASSSVYLYGGSGNDTLFGGTGNDFLYGGLGTNTFKFTAGWGQDTIEDWTAGTNSIIDLTGLSSLGVHAVTDLTQTINGGNDVITSSHTGTNSITLLGVGSALTAGSFHFA